MVNVVRSERAGGVRASKAEIKLGQRDGRTGLSKMDGTGVKGKC